MAEILVVEDEQLVMEMTTELLSSLGHQVLQAETGAAALRILTDDAVAKIDLVLLDLSLPDCDGIELLPKLRQYIPELKIIVCSGDTSAAAEIKRLTPPVAFLGKPFSLLVLEKVVANSLQAT